MTKTTPVLYVIRHLNGKYVYLDRASGGYPGYTDDLHRAEWFTDFEKAFHYRGVFASNDGFDSENWRIVRCEIQQQTVSLDTWLNEQPAPTKEGE